MTGKFPPPGASKDTPAFRHPSEIVRSSLDRETKIRLLQEWEQDLRRMLATSDENMAGPNPGEAGDTLRAVSDAFIALGADGAEAPGVPTTEGTKPREATEKKKPAR